MLEKVPVCQEITTSSVVSQATIAIALSLAIVLFANGYDKRFNVIALIVAYPTSCRRGAACTIRWVFNRTNVFLSYFLQAQSCMYNKRFNS